MNDGTMAFHDWANRKQDEIDQAVLACFRNAANGGWQENTISATVLEALGDAQECAWEDRTQRVSWQTCKLAGKTETERGDIAIRVRVHLSPKTWFDGVAFYEAKRAFYDDAGNYVFASIDAAQLDRMHAFSFGESNVLLYQILTGAQQPQAHCGDAQVIPLSFLRALKKSNLVPHHSLRHLGEPFMEILMRHLMGFHLDTRDEALQAFDEGLGRFAYVITAETDMTQKMRLNPSQRWNLRDLYVPLDAGPRAVPGSAEADPAQHAADEPENDQPDTPAGDPPRFTF
jgi:hypothetical protein